MPRYEGAQEQVAEEAIFHQDGSLNEAFLSEQFGLGIEEATQEVVFGNHTGTVAQMLNDENCPVGGIIRTAYQEGGLARVAEKFTSLSVLDSRFSVKISQVTIQREQLKKK